MAVDGSDFRRKATVVPKRQTVNTSATPFPEFLANLGIAADIGSGSAGAEPMRKMVESAKLTEEKGAGFRAKIERPAEAEKARKMASERLGKL